MDNYFYQAYGEFINQFPWEWYCILTFRDEISHQMAYKLFNKWKIELKKTTRQCINYLLFIEPTRLRKNAPHLHALVSGVAQEKPYIWQKRWFIIGGQAKIKLYNPKLGAAYYLGKKIGYDRVDIVFSKDLRNLATNGFTLSKENPVTDLS